jgi:hypothetical protein
MVDQPLPGVLIQRSQAIGDGCVDDRSSVNKVDARSDARLETEFVVGGEAEEGAVVESSKLERHRQPYDRHFVVVLVVLVFGPEGENLIRTER